MPRRVQHTDLRGLPAYGLIEASRYLGIPAPTLKSWMVGRSYTTSSGEQRSEQIIKPAGQEPLLLSFTNLVEAQVLGIVRKVHQLTLAKARAGVDYIAKVRPEIPHPLANIDFSTDGLDLFVDFWGQVVNASRGGQVAFPDVVLPYLKRIERDEHGLALRLYPLKRRDATFPRIVMIDPQVSFGRPCLSGTGIPVAMLAERKRAGDSINELAEDYARAAQEIAQAIEWEEAA